MCSAKGHVRFTPENGHSVRLAACPLVPIGGRCLF
jgi:hypothetical protein